MVPLIFHNMDKSIWNPCWFNSMRPRQNGCHFADIFKSIFLNENLCILIWILLKFNPKGQIDRKTALVQIMAWRRTGNKPLSQPIIMICPSSVTHICGTRKWWVNIIWTLNNWWNYFQAWLISCCEKLTSSVAMLKSLLGHGTDCMCDQG